MSDTIMCFGGPRHSEYVPNIGVLVASMADYRPVTMHAGDRPRTFLRLLVHDSVGLTVMGLTKKWQRLIKPFLDTARKEQRERLVESYKAGRISAWDMLLELV
jgi:hypothetical protein